MSFQASEPTAAGSQRCIVLICAKGGLDERYLVLIMANLARMTGGRVSVLFTFCGLDVITESQVDHPRCEHVR